VNLLGVDGWWQGTGGGVAAGEGEQEECAEELEVGEGGCGWSSISEKSGS